jgi:hypothetical protein
MSNYTSHQKKCLSSMFALLTVVTLAVPYTALGAGRAVGNSGAFGVSRPSRQQTFSRGFHDSRFFGGDGIGGAEVTVEQSHTAPTAAPDKPANKRYLQPRWVDGGYGVEVLEPGYWIDTGKESRR